MSKSDPKLSELKSLLALGKSIAENFEKLDANSSELLEFTRRYKALGNFQTDSLQKIAALAPKISQSQSLRHFTNFLIPLERELGLRITDVDILGNDKDGVKNPQISKVPLIFIAENWRSAFNIGSLFRTAECLAIEEIFLIGYSPTPENDKVKQTAMGCENLVDWRHFESIDQALIELKSKNYKTYAVETSPKALPALTENWPQKTALIFGNERFGILPETLEKVDAICKLEVYGNKNSLNVAITASIIGYAYRQNCKIQ